MKLTHTFALSSLILAMGLPTYAQDISQEETADIEKISIIGVRQDRMSKGATGLTMELNETPQSISVINTQLMEDFAANNVNDALALATGITVDKSETNRTSYRSRGFGVKSTQVDGVGLPNSWGLVTGDIESYGYQEIEVIRGANGQLTGVGNSAGTINYVRKRPTNENEGEVGITLGSYDEKRIEADYSILLTESGSWAARVVAVLEDSESYLDGLEDERSYVSFVVDGQVTDNSTIAFGASYQDADTDGNMWGGLVFNYSDGTQAEFDVSASPAQDWTKWDTINANAFVEYTHEFDNDWEIKATYNRQDSKDNGKLFYIYASDFDSETNLGLAGYPGQWGGDFNANLFDVTAKGEYSLFNQNHELMIGTSLSDSNDITFTNPATTYSDAAWGLLPAFPFATDAIAEPTWDDRVNYSEIDVTLTRVFGSTKLNITDDFFVVAGFNAINYKREGDSNGVEIDNDENEISPYLAATYSINEDINLYVGYSDIYQPQEEYNIDGEFLNPSKGVNLEIGLKTQWFDDNLLATFALFSAEQENIAAFAGVDSAGLNYYEGTDIESTGFELEVTGQVTDNLNLVFGYVFLDIEDAFGEDTNKWVATDTLNFSLAYNLPALPELSVGLGGKWQSSTENETNGVKQGSYALINAFARWNISKDLTVQANIDNITDEKYITSLETVGYYGAPVNGRISVSYSF